MRSNLAAGGQPIILMRSRPWKRYPDIRNPSILNLRPILIMYQAHAVSCFSKCSSNHICIVILLLSQSTKKRDSLVKTVEKPNKIPKFDLSRPGWGITRFFKTSLTGFIGFLFSINSRAYTVVPFFLVSGASEQKCS